MPLEMIQHILNDTILLEFLYESESDQDFLFDSGRTTRKGWMAFVTRYGNMLLDLQSQHQEVEHTLSARIEWNEFSDGALDRQNQIEA
jgi:hypothetical protein